MRFELSSALIDEILFFMEDQQGDFTLDTLEGGVISALESPEEGEEDEEGRYVSLPGWGPSDGFRLMERFTAALHNALVREELSAALDRGRGVFRAFKNTLARYPETEKLWYAYKDREMKRVVISWYNALRESWGMELIGEEPEDIACLALEDFRFRRAEAADREKAERLHLACLETQSGVPCENAGVNGVNPGGGFHAAEVFSGMGEWVFPGDIGFTAETSGGEFAGYVSAALAGDSSLRVCAVEVKDEYRGLGLGKALVALLLEQADSAKTPAVIIDLPEGQGHFSRALLRENFRPCVRRYVRATS
ncbi:MAG: UPF0158 family protein [Treponema sp.]|nr:UPF0158 family protein [Treponema sp.]